MARATHEIAGQAHWKLSAILRTRRYHSNLEVITLYKAQVLSYIEASTAAIAHAPDFFLAQVDRVQIRLLDELGVTHTAALLEYKLAPIRSRRDIALLGLIHRSNLQQAPPQFSEFFFLRPSDSVDGPRQWRLSPQAHNMQVFDAINGSHTRIMERSSLGLVYAYNALPQQLVDLQLVKLFQKKLQAGLLRMAQQGVANWANAFRGGVRSMKPATFQSFFQPTGSAV